MPLSTDPLTTDALSIIVLNYNKDEQPNRQLNDVDYSFSAPSVNSNLQISAKDTVVTASPFATSGKYGKTSIYYNRLKLSDLTSPPPIVKNINTTMADVVNQINSYYGINMVEADYVPVSDLTGTNVTLVARATSYLFIGQVTLTFSF